MIGVIVTSSKIDSVREFFELFKTPYEFFGQGRTYDVIISDDAEAAGINSRLVVLMDGGAGGTGGSLSDGSSGPDLLETAKGVFPVYCGARSKDGGAPIITRLRDRKIIGVRCSEAGKVILRIGFDLFDEVHHLLTHGQPVECAGYPTLDLHVDHLRGWMLEAGVAVAEIPPAPAGNRFFACLTHDVDHAGIRNHAWDRTAAGFAYRAFIGSTVHWLHGAYSIRMLVRNWLALASLPFVQLGLARDFWRTFQRYNELETGVGSTFFLVPFRDTPGIPRDGKPPNGVRAVKYEVSELQEDVDDILHHGGEVAVHGIDSWADSAKGSQEAGKIKALARQSKMGVRMHWLYFSPASPILLENAGFDYDSTCGFNERIGFKAGTLQVFKPFGVKHLLELPLHVMDTALFYPDRMNLNRTAATAAIQTFIQIAERFGGALTLNWHDRSIAPERLWDGVYREALNELRGHGARLSTAGAVVDWFRKRRAIRLDEVKWHENGLEASLAAHSAQAITAGDEMVLKVSSPRGTSLSPESRHVVLDGRSRIEVAC